MKNCKTSWRSKQRAALFSLPASHTPLDKTLLYLWNKNFVKGIYRNIKTFAFKLFQECSSWASRNGAVHIFFLTPNRAIFARKCVKSETFLVMLREHSIFNIKWVEIHEMRFCWLWDFLVENLKLKKNSDDVHWNV